MAKAKKKATKKPAKKKAKKKVKKSTKAVIGAGTGALVAGPVGAVAGAYLGPRINPRRNPDVSSMESMRLNIEDSPSVVPGTVVVEGLFEDSSNPVVPIIASYEKSSGDFASQYVVLSNRNGSPILVVNSPEFDGFTSGDDAYEGAIVQLDRAFEAAQDYADVKAYANPASRDLSPDEFYAMRDIEEFEREMSSAFEAALTEIQEKKTNQQAVEQILKCMSAEVGNMMRLALDDRFEYSAEKYRESDPHSILVDVSYESLVDLKGNIDGLKGRDFTTMSTAEFNERLLG